MGVVEFKRFLVQSLTACQSAIVRRKEARKEMSQTYTAVIQNRGDWWIGWIEGIPGVNCQEKTRSELLETLKTTLREALELRC